MEHRNAIKIDSVTMKQMLALEELVPTRMSQAALGEECTIMRCDTESWNALEYYPKLDPRFQEETHFHGRVGYGPWEDMDDLLHGGCGAPERAEDFFLIVVFKDYASDSFVIVDHRLDDDSKIDRTDSAHPNYDNAPQPYVVRTR